MVSSLTGYKNALAKIRKAAEEYSYLWDSDFSVWADFDSRLQILEVVKDEQQNWKENYGITKSKDGDFFYYNNSRKISAGELAKKIQQHEVNGANITPKMLVQNFVDALREPLARYETAKARIHEKVKKKMTDLEERLLD